MKDKDLIPEKLTPEWIEHHSHIRLVGSGFRWTVLAWRNVIFLKISEIWTPEEMDEYVTRLSALPEILTEQWGRIFFVFDLSRMKFKEEDASRYLSSQWLAFLDREDINVCIVEESKLRRILFRSLYLFIAKLDKIKLFSSCNKAFSWIRKEILGSETSPTNTGCIQMTDSDKLKQAQDFITRTLQKQGTVRIDAIDWEQTPQGRVSRYHRLVISRGDEKSIFKFTEYELLKDYGSKKWENRLRSRVTDILIEFEMGERIGETLVRIGVIKPYQVDEILRTQKNGDLRRFGEIAIEFGYINDEVLKKYVEA